jgi:hypothetical protein
MRPSKVGPSAARCRSSALAGYRLLAGRDVAVEKRIAAGEGHQAIVHRPDVAHLAILEPRPDLTAQQIGRSRNVEIAGRQNQYVGIRPNDAIETLVQKTAAPEKSRQVGGGEPLRCGAKIELRGKRIEQLLAEEAIVIALAARQSRTESRQRASHAGTAPGR